MVLNSVFKNNKRGWVIQVVLSIVILFAVGLVWMLTIFTQKALNVDIQSTDQLDNSSKALMQEQVDATPSVFDDAIGLVAVIVWIIVLGFAYKAPGNPFFMVAVVVIIAAVSFASMILANVWSTIVSDPNFVITIASMPITDFLISNYLVYVLALFFSGILSYVYGSGGLG